MTLFCAYAETIKERKKLKAHKTYLGARIHISRFQKYFKDKRLTEINDSLWSTYCESRRAQFPNCSLFDDRKWLGVVMLAAYRDGLIAHRIFLTNYSRHSEVGREIPQSELNRLRLFADEKLRLQIDIALEMGLRKMEMLALRWNQIDFDRRLVRLLPGDTKTQTGRIVPIPGHIFERIRALYQKKRGAHVFPGQNDSVRHQESNSVPWVRVKKKSAVTARWHDLRHTCATRMIRAGVALPTISRMLGMGIGILSRVYAHIHDDDLWDAIEKTAGLKVG